MWGGGCFEVVFQVVKWVICVRRCIENPESIRWEHARPEGVGWGCLACQHARSFSAIIEKYL
jgi:hypothetical protein